MSSVLDGKSIYGGVVISRIHFHGKKDASVVRRCVEDTRAEILRFEDACKKAQDQLRSLYDRMLREAGIENAGIFEGQLMILEDENFIRSVKQMIAEQSVNAEYAVDVTGNHFAEVFSGLEDEYFRARSIDVKDISQRLKNVLEKKEVPQTISEPCIIMAEELTPSETVQMDRKMMLGLVTRLGSSNSHTAILARTFGIPAVAGVDISEEMDGAMAVIDGHGGQLIVDPDEETLAFYREKIQEENDKKALLEAYKGKETINRFGKKICVYANIGELSDLAAVLENDAEGVGLFRSEFSYLKENDFPTEEDLFLAYRQLAEKMRGKRVVIRTLDIGTDKKVGYLNLQEEENPALGYRAIRICLTREDIFRTQLRAILRASAYGQVAIMYPMIASLWEVKKIKGILEEVKQELDGAGIPYGKVEQGIVVETPAAAVISDLLAKEVEFFSIGTNDLAQYTLAVDRQNLELDMFYDARHEAILRLMRMTVENAHKAGIRVGICGELGADTTLTDTFMEMGIDELSVAPSQVLAVKQAIIGGKDHASG